VKISAKLSIVIAAIFATICFGVALEGFMALGTLEGQVRADALGFAWFWTFLGAIAVVFGALGVWLVRTAKEHGDA
jgi:hypothetical protein